MTELVDDMENLKLTTQYRKLSAEEKASMIMELLVASTHGRLHRGVLKSASERWKCGLQTVYRAWKAYKHQSATARDGVSFASNARNSGRRGPSEMHVADLYDRMSKLLIERRGDLRTLSSALNIPRSTLHRYVKKTTYYA